MFRMMVQSNKIHHAIAKDSFSAKADWHRARHASRLVNVAFVQGSEKVLR